MSPLAHAAISYLPRRRVSDVVIGLLPDLPNVLLVTRRDWLPESDMRVRASRVTHSPLIVALLILMSRGRAWAYAVHWLCDAYTHDKKQWGWPLAR